MVIPHLQSSKYVVSIPDIEVVPPALRLEVLDVESNPGAGPGGLHHPGALHVGGVVTHGLRQPALSPVLSQLHLSSTELTFVSPPAFPALAFVGLALWTGGVDTVSIVTTITDCSLPSLHWSSPPARATLTGGEVYTADH